MSGAMGDVAGDVEVGDPDIDCTSCTHPSYSVTVAKTTVGKRGEGTVVAGTTVDDRG